MTIFAYPDTLPCFEATPFSYQQFNSIEVTTFKSGRPRFTRKFKNAPVTFQLSAVMTTDELGTFESWIFNVLEDVGQFSAALNTGSTGKASWTVRLLNTDISKKALSGSQWEVSFPALAQKQRYLNMSDTMNRAYGLPLDFGTKTLNAVGKYYL